MNPGSRAKNVIYDKYVYLLVASIAVFYLINNFIWLKLNIYPHGPDEFSHLLISQNFYNGIISGKIACLVKLFELSTDAIWPPFYHFTAAVLCFISGASYVWPLVVNLVYLIILLFSVYSIGHKLYNKNVGILATLLVSLYPMVFRYSRFFGLDFAQMAIISLCICFLINSDNFSSRKFSILFGISIGIGMLIKWAFLLFLIGPLACVILQTFLRKDKSGSLPIAFSNLFLSLLIGILIMLTWYLPSYIAVLTRLKMFLRTVACYHPAHLSVQGISAVSGVGKFFDYLCILVNEQISLIFFFVFILSLPIFIKKSFNRLFLLSWYILPYILLSLSSQKEGRFMLSSLPAIALISAVGLNNVSFPRFNYFLKHFLFASILSLGLVQFFDVSYNYQRKERTFPIQTPVGLMHMFYYPSTEQNKWAYGPPYRKDWKIEEIAVSIANYSYNQFQNYPSVFVGVISEDDYVRRIFSSHQVLDYYFVREVPRPSFTVVDFLSYPGKEDISFIKKINELNYVVFISWLKSWPDFNDLKYTFNKFLAKVVSLNRLRNDLYGIEKPYDFKDATERLQNFLEGKDKNFLLIDKIRLPDGYYAYVYARKEI